MHLYLIISYRWDYEEGEEKDVRYYGIFFDLNNKDAYLEKYKDMVKTDTILDVQEVILNKAFWEEGFVTVY